MAHEDSTAAELRQAALDANLKHLVGRSRAFLLELDGYLNEIGSLRDERAARVVEALGLTLAETGKAGTLRHVERAATELLRSLNEVYALVRAE